MPFSLATRIRSFNASNGNSLDPCGLNRPDSGLLYLLLIDVTDGSYRTCTSYSCNDHSRIENATDSSLLVITVWVSRTVLEPWTSGFQLVIDLNQAEKAFYGKNFTPWPPQVRQPFECSLNA